jgi:hypothetical protein
MFWSDFTCTVSVYQALASVLAVIIASRPCEQLTAWLRYSLRLLWRVAAEAKIEAESGSIP